MIASSTFFVFVVISPRLCFCGLRVAPPTLPHPTKAFQTASPAVACAKVQ
jgi:hypothetical protein